MSSKNKTKVTTHFLSEVVERKDVQAEGFRADIQGIDSKNQRYSYLTASYKKLSKRSLFGKGRMEKGKRLSLNKVFSNMLNCKGIDLPEPISREQSFKTEETYPHEQ